MTPFVYRHVARRIMLSLVCLATVASCSSGDDSAVSQATSLGSAPVVVDDTAGRPQTSATVDTAPSAADTVASATTTAESPEDSAVVQESTTTILTAEPILINNVPVPTEPVQTTTTVQTSPVPLYPDFSENAWCTALVRFDTGPNVTNYSLMLVATPIEYRDAVLAMVPLMEVVQNVEAGTMDEAQAEAVRAQPAVAEATARLGDAADACTA